MAVTGTAAPIAISRVWEERWPALFMPNSMITLENVKEMFIAWMKVFLSSPSYRREGSTGITWDPVRPFIKPVRKPTGAFSLRSDRSDMIKGLCASAISA